MQLRLFIHIPVGIFHLAVIAACRSEDKALDAGLLALFDQLKRSVQVYLARQIRVEGTSGISNDRGQMNNSVPARYCCFVLCSIANISANKLESWMAPRAQQRFSAVDQTVQYPHLMTLSEQQGC